MANLDVKSAIVNVRSMLSGLSSWQAICGVSSSGSAADKIFYGGQEDVEEFSLAPCCVLSFDPMQTTWMSTSRGQLTIKARFEIPIPEEHQLSYSDRYVYAWEKMSAILAGINGAVNGSGQLMLQNLNVDLEPGEIDPNENNKRIEWGFILAIVLDFL
jgi:hypothetical protein